VQLVGGTVQICHFSTCGYTSLLVVHLSRLEPNANKLGLQTSKVAKRLNNNILKHFPPFAFISAPFTKYRFKIRAFTKRREGPASENLVVITDTEAPSPPRVTNITCYGNVINCNYCLQKN
jgi:hypothetical protein